MDYDTLRKLQLAEISAAQCKAEIKQLKKDIAELKELKQKVKNVSDALTNGKNISASAISQLFHDFNVKPFVFLPLKDMIEGSGYFRAYYASTSSMDKISKKIKELERRVETLQRRLYELERQIFFLKLRSDPQIMT